MTKDKEIVEGFIQKLRIDLVKTELENRSMNSQHLAGTKIPNMNEISAAMTMKKKELKAQLKTAETMLKEIEDKKFKI